MNTDSRLGPMPDLSGPDLPVVRRTMSRRAFLVVGAGGAAALSGLTRLGDGLGAIELADAANPLAPKALDQTIVINRALDQCLLTLDLYNLEPKFGGAFPVLHKPRANTPSYLSVSFQPQHVAEQSFVLTDDAAHALKAQPDGTPRSDPGTAPSPPPVASAVAGGTQLVFIVPDGLLDPESPNPLHYDTATLLDWSSLTMSVVPNAVPQGAKPSSLARPSAPTSADTAIELPFRVQLSPVGSTAWVNAAEPVTHNGWTELWHTRLAAKLGGLQVVTTPGVHLDADIIDQPQWFEDDAHRDERTVRAIWCLDNAFAASLTSNASLPTSNTMPFDTSLQPRDRGDIVRLSSDFGLVANNRTTSTGAPFIPAAATVDRLILSAYGATMDLEDHWDLAPSGNAYNSSLLQWRHRTWVGRDTHVRVVRKGYLFPFGHRASLITINERKLSTGSGTPGAYLRERIFLVIGQPIKNYAGAAYIGNDGRKLPFTSIEAVTLTTPNLDAEKTFVPGFGLTAPYCFQPLTNGDPFLFHFRGTDYDGGLTDFRSPVVWVDDTIAYGGPGKSPVANKTLDQIVDAIIDQWTGNFPSIDLRRSRVSIAPPNVGGDTNVCLESFELGVEHASAGNTNQLIDAAQPNFIPTAHTLTLHMPEVTTMCGNDVGGPVLEYNGTYLANGFDGMTTSNGHQVVNPNAQNRGEIILSRPSTISNSPGVKFQADKGGGAITPNFGIDAYTRTLGPAGAAQSGDISTGLANLASGTFDPKSIFDAADAHLLGGVPLSSILGQMGFGAGAESGQALQLTNRQTSPSQITTLLDWQPPLIPGGPKIAGQTVKIFFPVDSGGNKYEGTDDPNTPDPGIPDLFNLHAVVVTDLNDSSKSTYSIVGQLGTFELDLFGDGDTYFLQIPFNSLTFHAQKDKKTEVQVDVGDVQFVGALNFVQQMASFLSFTGSGLTISTEGAGITVDLQVSIPSIGIGVLSIQNIAFDAGCLIPYNGDPVAFNFSFCTRDNPFTLSVMCFEGGGFVGLAITAKGLEILEFSFEFGLGYSIDIGIASGNIELDGGIYFSITTRSDGTQALDFTAFIKAGGGVSALGVISVSVELYLALSYESGDSVTGTPAKLAGDATLTISVHVLFFGGSISIGMHEEFDAGSSTETASLRRGGDEFVLFSAEDLPPPPTQTIKTFGDMITSADVWSQYTTSFVPAGG